MTRRARAHKRRHAAADPLRAPDVAGTPTLALTEVVIAMTTRGELQPRLLQTSGGGDLWRISDLGEEGATAALQAGVHWGFLVAADRTPFRARWRAAQARAEWVLGFTMTVLMTSDPAGRYREQIRARDARAREAWERAGRRSGAGGSAPPGGASSAGHRP